MLSAHGIDSREESSTQLTHQHHFLTCSRLTVNGGRMVGTTWSGSVGVLLVGLYGRSRCSALCVDFHGLLRHEICSNIRVFGASQPKPRDSPPGKYPVKWRHLE
jgi:hypothetical protein